MHSSRSSRIKALCGWLVFCFTASLTAVFVSTRGWYTLIHKPTWNPPARLFGPVWTLLYVMMAIAAWLIWCEGGWNKQAKALRLFLVQWGLNALWTPLFFGLHMLGVAFTEITVLWIAIIFTLISFYKVRPLAGVLLVPYLLWVSFAGTLSGTIWWLNH